jgi:hypothetical protein
MAQISGFFRPMTSHIPAAKATRSHYRHGRAFDPAIQAVVKSGAALE